MLNQIQSAAFPPGSPQPTFGVGVSVGDIVSKAIPWIFTLSGMALLIYLVFGGLQLMLSQGEPKAAQAARSHVTNALIGFAIIFFAYWIIQILGLVLNLPGIKSVFR